MKYLLPLFALGLGAYFLTKKKSVTTDNSSNSNNSKPVNNSKNNPTAEDFQRGFQVLPDCSIVAIDENRAYKWIANLGINSQNSSIDHDRWYAFGACQFWDFKPSLFAYKLLQTLFASKSSKVTPENIKWYNKLVLDNLSEMLSKATASGMDISNWPPLPDLKI